MLARALVAQRDLIRGRGRDRAAAEGAIRSASGRAGAARHAGAAQGQSPRSRGPPSRRRSTPIPTSIAALTGLTMLDVQEKRLGQARARVEQRLTVEPKRPALLLVAAKVYVQSGDLTSAERLLRQAIDRAPIADRAVRPSRRDLPGAEAARQPPARSSTPSSAPTPPTCRPAPWRPCWSTRSRSRRTPSGATRSCSNIEPRAAVAANNLAWIYADEQQNLDEALQLAAARHRTDARLRRSLGHARLGVLSASSCRCWPSSRSSARSARIPTTPRSTIHLGLALAGSGDRVPGPRIACRRR